MADKLGADYNKRLNYDELKDKITKKKQPINAPSYSNDYQRF